MEPISFGEPPVPVEQTPEAQPPRDRRRVSALPYSEWALWVRRQRDWLGLSRLQLAKEAGCSPEIIKLIESGRHQCCSRIRGTLTRTILMKVKA